MSLDSGLTVERLRQLAGYAFPRGDAYWREGRVRSCAREGEALIGVVVGTEPYTVQVRVSGRTLVGDCSCPVGDGVCKHVVALGLSYLANGATSEPRHEEDRNAGGFATRHDVDRFAAEHQIGYALAISAESLCPVLGIVAGHEHWIRGTLARLGLGDVATRQGAARFVTSELAKRVPAAARARLEREASSVRTGLEEEADLRLVAPAVKPLWDRLRAIRADVRRDAAPRSRASRATGKWRFDAAQPAITWTETDRIVRAAPEWGAVAVTTRLAALLSTLSLECACRAEGGRCTHALALIDATLDVLVDPARAEEAGSLVTELTRPAWSRVLVELSRLDDRTAKQAAPIELWWQIESELGASSITPIVKKQAQRGKTKGAWTAGARTSLARVLGELRGQLDDRDLLVAEHLDAWTAGSRTSSYPVRALAALVGHPRVTTDHEPTEPIAVVRTALGFSAHPAGPDIRLEPSIDGERISPRLLAPMLRTFAPDEPLLLLEPEHKRCVLVDVSDEARKLWSVLERHGDVFPPESHAELLTRLTSLERRLPLAVPIELKGTQLGEVGTTVVRLRLLPDTTLEAEVFVRPAVGAPLFHPGDGPRDVMVVRTGARGYARRDLAGEDGRARRALGHLPLDGATEGPPWCFQLPDPEAALAVVATVQAGLPEGLEAEWIDAVPSVGRRIGLEALKVSVERKRDWFGIRGDLRIESGRLELAVVLDAVRRQQRFVRVDERRWIELADTLRAKLQPLADQTYANRKELEIGIGAVPAVHQLGEAGARVDVGADWEQLTTRMLAATASRPRQPRGLTAILRDYQKDGYAWLSRVAGWGAGAVLADDMGLGKTVQAIALMLERSRTADGAPALVIAPTSVTYNWQSELARFAPGLRVVLHGEQVDRERALADLGAKDVLITSYGLLAREVESLARIRFSTLVLDEAQALKNPATLRAKAARKLDAGFRVALTGTPLENHLGELWSLYAIVFPGLLGSWDQFRDRFATPIERTGDPEARAALARVLRPFLLRRTKGEVAQELPPRTEVHVPIALAPAERALYEDARLAAVAELGVHGKKIRNEQQRFAVLAALTRLRLLASHPKLYDATSEVASSKLRRLIELVEELRSEGHRALVFSQFTSHLALVRTALDQAGVTMLYLDGATTPPQRAKLIERFQRGEGDVFLISLKAGGTGINLTAADYVIHLDPWWNPAVEDQATDRAHRIGQDRPVTVYRLVTRGTIEEQILAMHADKRALVAGVLEGTSAAAKLSTTDLMALLTNP